MLILGYSGEPSFTELQPADTFHLHRVQVVKDLPLILQFDNFQTDNTVHHLAFCGGAPFWVGQQAINRDYFLFPILALDTGQTIAFCGGAIATIFNTFDTQLLSDHAGCFLTFCGGAYNQNYLQSSAFWSQGDTVHSFAFCGGACTSGSFDLAPGSPPLVYRLRKHTEHLAAFCGGAQYTVHDHLANQIFLDELPPCFGDTEPYLTFCGGVHNYNHLQSTTFWPQGDTVFSFAFCGGAYISGSFDFAAGPHLLTSKLRKHTENLAAFCGGAQLTVCNHFADQVFLDELPPCFGYTGPHLTFCGGVFWVQILQAFQTIFDLHNTDNTDLTLTFCGGVPWPRHLNNLCAAGCTDFSAFCGGVFISCCNNCGQFQFGADIFSATAGNNLILWTSNTDLFLAFCGGAPLQVVQHSTGHCGCYADWTASDHLGVVHADSAFVPSSFRIEWRFHYPAIVAKASISAGLDLDTAIVFDLWCILQFSTPAGQRCP